MGAWIKMKSYNPGHTNTGLDQELDSQTKAIDPFDQDEEIPEEEDPLSEVDKNPNDKIKIKFK